MAAEKERYGGRGGKLQDGEGHFCGGDISTESWRVKNQTWTEPEIAIPVKGNRACQVLDMGNAKRWYHVDSVWGLSDHEATLPLQKGWLSRDTSRLLPTILHPSEDNSLWTLCDQLCSCPVKAGRDVWRVSIWDLVGERTGKGEMTKMMEDELGVDDACWLEPTPSQSCVTGQLPSRTQGVSVNPRVALGIAVALKVVLFNPEWFHLCAFLPHRRHWKPGEGEKNPAL